MADQQQSEEAASPLSAIDLATAHAVAAVVLRLQGPCRVLFVGAGCDALTRRLRLAGCDVAWAMDAASFTSMCADGHAKRVEADIAVVLPFDGDLAAQVLDLQVPSLLLLASRDSAVPDEWWRVANSAGWALHSGSWVMQESIDGHAVLALARTGVGLDSPEAILQANVFSLAAALVRAGDDALIHAPSATDAWRIVREQSRCGWLGVSGPTSARREAGPLAYVPVTTLGGIDGQQMDFLLLADMPSGGSAEALLLQAQRLLRRSGRLLVEKSSPDITDWDAQCRQLESCGFVVDRAWLLRGGSPTTAMQRIELDLTSPIQPQWVADGVLVVMAVLVEGPGYAQLPDSDAPNIVAFQRDYLDASLVRLIVAMGYRLDSAVQRRAVALDVLDRAPPGSADHGAALCVLLYDDGAMATGDGARILRLSRRYLEGAAVNPTALRWQISIAFVLARRSQADGHFDEALQWYTHVLAQDVLQFSPLLGTKTVLAAVAVGWIAFARGDLPAARQAWMRCLDEARRLASESDWREVLGDPGCPETFGLPEFAAVMDEAGSAAAALRLTAEVPVRPGLVWEWGNRSARQQIAGLQQELKRHRTWQDSLQRGKDWLHAQYQLLTQEVARLSADHAELHGQHEGALAASRLAHQAAEESLRRQRSLYADLLAAYRLAHQRSERQFAGQQQQYGDLLANYRLSHARAQCLHKELVQQLADQKLTHEQERAEAAARMGGALQLVAEQEDRYQGLLANYKLSRRYDKERISVLVDRYNGAVAAYRLGWQQAQREMTGLRAQLDQQQQRGDQLQRQLERLGDDHDAHHEVHMRLVGAADDLGRACGRVMGGEADRVLRGEDLALEMERLAAIIEKLPMRPVLRVLFRIWRRLSMGRK